MTQKITPEIIAQMYAYMAWNGLTFEQAKEKIETLTYDQINEETYAEDSINAAKEGVQTRIPKDTKNKIAIFDEIMKILDDIHKKWVVDNAKKYDRDAEKNDKRLFQHLPTALIGCDEVCKDLLFLNPFLKEIGIEAGQFDAVPYGSFVPSKDFAEAYDRFVAKYLVDNKVKNLESHIAEIINKDPALAGDGEKQVARRTYMLDRTALLAKQAIEKNPTAFAPNGLAFD